MKYFKNEDILIMNAFLGKIFEIRCVFNDKRRLQMTRGALCKSSTPRNKVDSLLGAFSFPVLWRAWIDDFGPKMIYLF